MGRLQHQAGTSPAFPHGNYLAWIFRVASQFSNAAMR
jgi:hypothetical protein